MTKSASSASSANGGHSVARGGLDVPSVGCVFDGPRLAAQRASISGELDASRLTRLRDCGCSGGRLWYSIAGKVLGGGEGRSGTPALHVVATGGLEVVCQRCLQPMPMPVDVDVLLELAASRELAEAADDEVDRAVAGCDMDAASLIEDELILALPMVPMHAECAPIESTGAARQSPFAVLAELGKRGTSD